MPELLEPEQLAERLDDPELLIVDLSNPNQYAMAHVPRAHHVQPAELVSGTPPAPGRLPPEQALQALLGRLGFHPGLQVVAMDDEGGGWAGRLLWTLDMIGHHNWAYLNGGLPAWLQARLPVTEEVPRPQPTRPQISIDESARIDADGIMARLGGDDHVIWDCRSPAEYSGADVRARRGGHIPGAVNLDWLQLMDPERALRLREDLSETLTALGIVPQREVIVHCQTHHRSALAYLALRLAGFPRVRGYDGSWADWGNREDTPIEC